MDTSEACCTVPVAVVSGYVTKGTYEKIAGLDVYQDVTGSPTSTKGIIDAYDAMGISSQTLQGADILAAAVNAIVLVPDFFKGNACQSSWIPPDTEEKKAALAEWGAFARGAFGESRKDLVNVVKEAGEKWPSVKAWGAFGLCWGGKLCATSSGEGTPFKATGQVHPGALSVEDAEKISVPHILLASKDEPVEIVEKYAEIITGEGKASVVETYPTMHHGWMSARAKLEEEEFKKGYEKGYGQLATFFAKNL